MRALHVEQQVSCSFCGRRLNDEHWVLSGRAQRFCSRECMSYYLESER